MELDFGMCLGVVVKVRVRVRVRVRFRFRTTPSRTPMGRAKVTFWVREQP